MTDSIPRPPLPTRQRRSAIEQAAHASSAADPAGGGQPENQTPAHDGAHPQAPAPGAAPTVSLAPAAAVPPPQTASAGGSKRLGGRSKDILLTLPEEEKERMVNAISWTTPHTGISHQSRFIRYAIAKLCAELEQQFNAGEQFTPPAAPIM